MVLNSYNFEFGKSPNSLNDVSEYVLVSSPFNVETYDQYYGLWRNIKDGEIPLNENREIIIKRETTDAEQTQIQLPTSHTLNYFPFPKSTIILKGKITTLLSEGNLLMCDQWVENGYSWKLILYPDKIQLRKLDVLDWSPETFDYETKEKYIPLEINHNFQIGDIFIVVIRFNENNGISTNPDNLMKMDLSVNGTNIGNNSIPFNYNMTTNGVINFYDMDKIFESEYLLKYCFKIEDDINDSDITDLFTSDSEFHDVLNNDAELRQNINVIRRKTVILSPYDTEIEILSNNNIPNDRKLYIHGLQIRIPNISESIPFGYVMEFLDNNNTNLYYFTGVYNGSDYFPPKGKYWTLDTYNMGVASYGPYGFLEEGVTEGIGIKFKINFGINSEIKITVYYSIE